MPSVAARELVLPTFASVPDRLSSSGEEAVELAASAGLHLDPWQAWALDQSLGERADGSWSAFEVAVIVSRQNGKGSIIEARELAGLFLLDEELVIHTAHEFKTAAEAFRRIRLLIEGAPHLRRRCRPPRMASGEEGIETHDGRRLKFVARSSGSGRGFSGDLVILDEAFALSNEEMAALLPTLSARPNPQIWYTSSAGMASSVHLRSVRDRGRAGDDPALCWLEWCAAADASDLDPLDRAGWLRANPGLGIRISEEFVEREQRALSAPSFLRERLGIWDEAAGGTPIPVDALLACVDPASAPASAAVVFCLDVEVDRGCGAVAVAGRREDGMPHAAVVDFGPGTAWMVARAVALQKKHPGAAFVVNDSGPAGSLLADLQAAGVPVTPMNTSAMAKACGALYDLTLTRGWRYPGERGGRDVLLEAVAGSARRKLGDAWAFDRRTSTSDICPLVAVTGALWGLSVMPAAEPLVAWR